MPFPAGHGQAIVARVSKPPVQRSALYDRANGFLLGCFLVLMRYRFARSSFAVHRHRVAEFLEEEGLTLKLPATHREFAGKADALLQQAVLRCHRHSPALGDFALAGAMACIDGVTRLAAQGVNDDLRREACDILARHGLAAAKLYDRFLALIVHEAEDAESPASTSTACSPRRWAC